VPPEIVPILTRLDEVVRAWNEADDTGNLDTCSELSAEIGVLTDSLCLTVLRRYGPPAVREHFGVDAPQGEV
jgi:hypothetical protein